MVSQEYTRFETTPYPVRQLPLLQLRLLHRIGLHSPATKAWKLLDKIPFQRTQLEIPTGH